MEHCDGCEVIGTAKDKAADWAQILSIAQQQRSWALVLEVVDRITAFSRAAVTVLIAFLFLGCSSATVFQYTRPDGTHIVAQSAKQQSEDTAKWSIKIGADGSLSLDLGTKGTQPVNMTADTLNALIGLAATGVAP